jgi:hypothetical protein
MLPLLLMTAALPPVLLIPVLMSVLTLASVAVVAAAGFR